MFRLNKIIFVFLFLSFVSKAQTTYIMSNAGATINCASNNLFYDSGNIGGNYSNNESFTKTFTAPAGYCLFVNFGDFNSQACCDQLDIYDGPNTGSPLLASLAGNLGANGPYYASGSTLTFDFNSNGTTVRPGWEATITCQAVCSGVVPGGTVTNVSPTCPSTGSVQLSVNASYFGCGITYQWQSAPALAGPWTNIAGATFATLTVPVSTTVFYRRKTTCGASTGTSTAMASTSVITSGCDLSSYTGATTPYSFDSFVGTTTPSTDDVLFSTIVNFGFPFCYAGGQYWGGYIASNTSFVLDAVPCYPNIKTNVYAAGGVATGYVINNAAPINGTSIPRNAILGPWQDADPSVGGTIRYTTLGTAPFRRFVVSFESIPMFNCASSAATNFVGQIKLFETTNNIEIHIGNKALCVGWNGEDAVMGLHNYNGTVYVPPVNATAHNYPTNWTMTNTAYRFTSACAASGGQCFTLPVNFKSFYGQQVDGINKLTWETALEENVTEFIVERSTDATNFTQIGSVKPNNLPSKYDFNDATFKANVINYYRVTAVENGRQKSTYVLPIGGNFDDISVSEIYPNPIKDNFTLSYDAKVQTETEVVIKDLYGRTVKTTNHSIGVGNTRTLINCPELSAGVYIVIVHDKNTGRAISQQKLIVAQ